MDSRQLSAYKNDPSLKSAFVAELKWHQDADAFLRGTYGNGQPNGKFKGCGIGCSVNSMIRIHRKNPAFFPDPVIVNASTGDHKLLEELLNIPVELAVLMDTTFERLESAYPGQGKGAEFMIEMAEAIQPGADLSMVVPGFIYWVLTEDKRPFDPKYPTVERYVKAVTAVYEQWSRDQVKPPKDSAVAEEADLADIADRADLAYRADLADIADLAYLAARADLAYRADLADIADIAYLAARAYLADRAYRADRADRAYLAYRAARADLADLAARAYRAYRADLADRASQKLIELSRNSPVASSRPGVVGKSDADSCAETGGQS